MATRADHFSPPRRYIWQMTLACLLILLLAQVLVGALSWSALNRLVASNTADRIELAVRKEADTIQSGLNVGKPLAQYFGLEQILQSLYDGVPGLTSARVVLPDHRVLAAIGESMDTALVVDVMNQRERASGPTLESTSSGTVRRMEPHQVQLGLPLLEPGSDAKGALVVSVEVADTTSRAQLFRSGLVMLAITLAAALVLVVLLRRGLAVHDPALQSRLRRLIPIGVLLLAQVAVAAHTTQTFRALWLDVAHDHARTLALSVQSDLQKVLSHGIAIDRMAGADQYLDRVVASFPLIQGMRVVDRSTTLVSSQYATDADDFQLPLTQLEQPVAQLGIQLNHAALRAGVWSRVVDAATVGLIAVIAAMELLGLLELAVLQGWLQRRTRAGEYHQPNRSLPPELARPAMFGLLFAWALPLGFMPLYARSLVVAPASATSLPFLMAAPIAVEMGAGLLAALLAGRLSDRHGWQRPVWLGFSLSMLGSLACAWVDSLAGLVLARAVVGMGYGLAWMGLQGLVVLNTPVHRRGQQMSSVVAGLFAGHLSGVAVGAMLMQQLGAPAVFALGAVLFLIPALVIQLLVRRYDQPMTTGASRNSAAALRSGVSLSRLLFSRDFGTLVFAAIMPFSIAQVGLLSFALPLFMEAKGAQASSVGRVLMIYGLFIIYLGPWMGRLADQSQRKKSWIVASGLAGSLGLLALAWWDGMMGAILAVSLLAFAGCLGGGAQTAYMLAMDRVQAYGPVGATSVMRAIDKVGQMLGPLLVASLFAWAGMLPGLALTGGLYLLATVWFLLLAPRQPVSDASMVSRRWL